MAAATGKQGDRGCVATSKPPAAGFSFLAMRAQCGVRRYTCSMSDILATRLKAALAAIPAALRPVVEMQAREMSPALAGLPASEWVDMLPRVFACSEFVARACAARAELLPELIRGGDLLRAYAAGRKQHHA